MGKPIIPRSEIPLACDERFAPMHSEAYASWRRLGIVRSGISHVVPGYHMARTQSRQLMVILSSGGRGYAHNEHTAWSLESGTLFMSGPNAPVAFGCDADTWDMYWWYLEVAEDFEIDYRFLACPHTDILCASMEALFSELGDVPRDQEWSLHKKETASLASAPSERALLLSELVASYLSELIDAPLHQLLDHQEQALSVLWREVDRNLHKDWTLNDFARHLDVSTATTQRWMHKYYQQSCHQMLIERRMHRASQLLLHTDYTLENIAQQLGYCDAFTFSNAFKQVRSLSPTHYKIQEASR